MSYLKNINKGEVDLAKIGVDSELLDLLYEVMFLGISRKFFGPAEAILNDYFVLKPQSERVRLGMGLYCIATEDFENAVKIFRDELPKNPYAKVYLGRAYLHQKKDAEAKKVLEEAIKDNAYPDTVALAYALLENVKTAA